MLTTTQDVPRDQWSSFFGALSTRREGSLVRMEVLGEDVGAQVEGESLRFEGVSTDQKDNENVIEVSLGDTPETHVTHIIASPTFVRMERSEVDGGALETLEIECEGGATTLVRFLEWVGPDRLDDVC